MPTETLETIMEIKTRGETLDLNDRVSLTVQFKDQFGRPVDTDSFPTISIIQPTGLVLLPPTSAGVHQLGCGNYSYILTIPYAGPYGVYNDIWVGFINGYRVETTFSFVVVHTQVPAINTDGHIHLGDDPGFEYSQCAIKNINKLLKSLKARLNSAGKAKSKDAYGNTNYVDCDIFSIDMLTTFLATVLWDFNQIPYFTSFNYEHDSFVDQFGEVLVEGATLYALSSQALIEKGRQYKISDNGINFDPPEVAEIMMTQYSSLLTNYWDKLKMIKSSLRPHPISLGVWGMTSAINPAFRRLRHLRERRLV
jgi:hypothetical protein